MKFSDPNVEQYFREIYERSKIQKDHKHIICLKEELIEFLLELQRLDRSRYNWTNIEEELADVMIATRWFYERMIEVGKLRKPEDEVFRKLRKWDVEIEKEELEKSAHSTLVV